MRPARLAEPGAVALIAVALVAIAALLIALVGIDGAPRAADARPAPRERPDRLPSVAEGEAAARACEAAGSWRMGECVIAVLDNSRFEDRLFQVGAGEAGADPE